LRRGSFLYCAAGVGVRLDGVPLILMCSVPKEDLVLLRKLKLTSKSTFDSASLMHCIIFTNTLYFSNFTVKHPIRDPPKICDLSRSAKVFSRDGLSGTVQSGFVSEGSR
jgi:hypothetical protein